MLTYIALVAVQFFIQGCMLSGTFRNLSDEFHLPYDGAEGHHWLAVVVTSFIPLVGPLGMLIGFVLEGGVGFSLKWTADIPEEAP